MWVYVIGRNGPEIGRDKRLRQGGGGGVNPTGGKWFGCIWTLPLPCPPQRLMLQGDQVSASVSQREVMMSGEGHFLGDQVSGEVMPHSG